MKSFLDPYIGRFCLGLLLLVAFCVKAEAQAPTIPCTKIAENVAHICWLRPVLREDGSAITATTTLRYDIELQTGSTWTKAATQLNALEWQSGALASGTYTYRILAFDGAISSQPSGALAKNATTSPPLPPAAVIAQVTITIPATCDTSVSPARCEAVLVSAR